MQSSFGIVVRVAFVAILVVTFAGNADAQKKGKKGKQADDGSNNPVFAIPKEITLTADQQTKLDEIKKEQAPKVAEATKKIDAILTDEQKAARKEAVAKANSNGVKGKERATLVNDVLKLTDEQKKQTQEAEAEFDKLRVSIKEQINGFLTDDQKEHFKVPKAKKAK